MPYDCCTVLEMAETAKSTYRFKDATRGAIKWWAKQDEVTDTEIVERAVAFYDEMRAGGGEVPSVVAIPEGERMRAVLRSDLRPGSDPANIPGVQRGVAVDAPKNASCIHCGSRFAGTKFATLCRECQAGGHLGDPRNCGGCTGGMAI